MRFIICIKRGWKKEEWMNGWKNDWLIDWSWNEITMIKKRVFVGNRRAKRNSQWIVWWRKLMNEMSGLSSLYTTVPWIDPSILPSIHSFIHSLSFLSHTQQITIHSSLHSTLCVFNKQPPVPANTNFTMLHVVALKQNQEIRNYSLDNSSCATHSHQSHPSLQNDRISARN